MDRCSRRVRNKVRTLTLALALLAMGFDIAHGKSLDVEPLPERWNPLAMITGVHSISNRKSGLALRVLEADGSAGVAENPISLFIVATNGGTSNLTQHVWRLPQGVERVLRVTQSKCGLDIQAQVDAGVEPVPGREGTSGAASKVVLIKTCFLGANGELGSTLRTEEIDQPKKR
jgi:hypothetical protein